MNASLRQPRDEVESWQSGLGIILQLFGQLFDFLGLLEDGYRKYLGGVEGVDLEL